jgi:type IV pilus assembly protein PilZ
MATMLAPAVRQDERYPVNLRVDCSSRDAFAASYATNVSRGGLFIASDRPLPPYSALELTLTLPGSSDRVRALGRVVWNSEIRIGTGHAGMGIKFLSMSCEDWGRLIDFLAGLPAPEAAPQGPSLRATTPALH